MMTEERICKALYRYIVAGKHARRTGERNQHGVNTVAFLLFSQGWLLEDLRLALMEKDAEYRAAQLREVGSSRL